MRVFKTVDSVKHNLLNLNKKFSLALVPTMGALHQGHLSIVKRAKSENDFVVVSIFVNPTQFDNEDDLKNYPITLYQDLKLLDDLDCDLVFVPTADEIYDTKIISEKFDFNGLDKVMEGTHRKGHFDGVGTVVKKLFEIIKPDKAYFGEKDFQQLQIIRKLTKMNNLPIQIIGCEIYREKNGLAMSSRNTRLTEKERKAAP
ncbi:Pantoate--beta-alanine ligase, partial [hydrothermal vent metagenome]